MSLLLLTGWGPREISMRAFTAAVFVDWNSQLRDAPTGADAVERARYAIRHVGKVCVRALQEIDQSALFRVRLRLYHGWTMGWSPTENRLAFRQLSETDDPDSIFPAAQVLALTDIEFGDRLLDALPEREVGGRGIHLGNTLRRQSYDTITEKMVDTALASDLLSWARSDPSSVALVISQDDDLIPPVLVAEAWMKPHGGQVVLMRDREKTDKYCNLKGLVH